MRVRRCGLRARDRRADRLSARPLTPLPITPNAGKVAVDLCLALLTVFGLGLAVAMAATRRRREDCRRAGAAGAAAARRFIADIERARRRR
jgi:hypothetical protein